MIWVRRALTVPLGILLLFVLGAAIVILEISDTFLDPGYYPRELRDANFYEFVMVDVPTSALNEARQIDGATLPARFDENPLVTLGLSTDDIVASLNTALPPEWLQDVVEQIFDELGLYIAGERDEFVITVRAGDQAVAMVSEVKVLLSRADAYTLLFDEFVTPAVDDALSKNTPVGLNITSEQLTGSVRNTVPPEWLQAQVEAALDEVTPYFVGETDSFEIRVQLADTAERALEEIKTLLRETDAYDLLYDEVVAPAVRSSLGESIELPIGITLTDGEVLTALREVAPPDWVQAQTERVIDEAGPYLVGRADTFAVAISLADNKRRAQRVIADLTSTKVEEAAGLLPECTASQVRNVLSGTLDSLPVCVPPGIHYDELVDSIVAGVSEAVDTYVLGAVPNEFVFTDVILRDTLIQSGGQENVELLDQVREIVRDGWAYSDADLRRDVFEAGGDDAVQRLDDLRGFLADGWTYTDRDLRDDLAANGDGSSLAELDRARSFASWARTLKLLVYVPMILILLSIGFLAGNSWSERIAWAAGSLVVTAGIIFLVSGPIFNTVGEPRIEKAAESSIADLELSGHFAKTQRLAADKLYEIATSAVDGFASGIAMKSSFLLVLGLLAMTISLGWSHIKGFVQRYRY